MPLKALLKERFASAINSIPPGTWKTLITDEHSQALLDTVFSNYEILQMNVTGVEPLMSPREKMSVVAIYLLTPTAQNVERIIADFASGRDTYKSAHLYFVDAIDDKLAQRLTDSLPRDKLRAFVELNCNFWATEDRVFSMQWPQSFFSMFGTLGGQVTADFAMEAFHDDMTVASRTMLNVLTTLNENPYIRYYQPTHHPPLGPLAPGSSTGLHNQQRQAEQQQQGSSLRWRAAMGSSRAQEAQGDSLSKVLAQRIQHDLDHYAETNPDFPAPSDRGRGILFVVDRSVDPCAPFLHEFWYQAMVNDLLPIKDGKEGRTYKYTFTNTVGGKETREAVLNEEDEVWCSVRHLHMKDAIDKLMTDFGKFVSEHTAFSGNAQNVQINDLKDMLADLPQFQTQRDQFSLHLDMAQECMAIFEQHKLNLAANVEQCCATGFTPQGKTPKTIVEEMVPLLDEPKMSSLDKVRIIALYILFRDGVADEDRRRLYQHARLNINEQDMINNLVNLGVRVIKGANNFRGSRIRNKYSNKDEEYDLSRYKPAVQIMLEDHHSNRLDQHQFPFVRDVPPELSQSLRATHERAPVQASPSTSLRSARPTWHKAASARNAANEHRQRYIIFVAGGVTYSEIRQAYVLGEALNKDIYIGSTHIITPESFLKDLRSLGRGGVGGNPPNAAKLYPGAPGRSDRRAPGEAQAYQAILDERHWVPFVGPPALAPPPPQQQQAHGAHGAHGGLHMPKLPHSGSSHTNLSVSSKDSKDSKVKEKKKGFFKKRW